MDRLTDKSISAAHFTAEDPGTLPARVRTVVVGGGIVGASTAYHLAAAGENDVVLLDSNVLGSGTTWHAAGLVTGARTTTTLTALASYGIETYAGLEQRTGLDISFTQCGSLMVARTPGRVDEMRYACDVARQGGVEAEIVDAGGVKRLWPLADVSGVLGGLYLPNDGHLNPGYAALGFAKLAHGLGVRIFEGVRVTSVLQRDGEVVGVQTDQGVIECERVVLAGGLWTRDLAATVNAHVPLYAAEHVHVRTQPIVGATEELAVFRDLDNSYYIRHELGRLLVGAFEPDGISRSMAEIPAGGFAEFPANWEHFEPIRSKAEAAVPALQSTRYERFLNAPESFTPDANFLLGETAEVRNLFVGAGFNSQGIIFAPGAGRELANWIIGGTPAFDASSVDVQRFSRHQSNRKYLHARTKEGLGRLYAMHWPHLQPFTARQVRRTPLHERTAALGAGFGELNGWERANWYGEPGKQPSYEYSYQRQNWFEQSAGEHRAAREGVVLFDLSSFTKIEVAGPDALALCQYAATANVDVAVDKAVYTLFLNADGGIELDGTITRLAADRFLVVTPSASQDKTLAHLRRLAEGKSVAIFDATAGLATIGVMGPQSRELLSRISPDDWSDTSQVYTEGRTVEIADGFAYALRISFVGELGYELYPSADLAVNVFDALWAAGQDLGVRMAGYHALDSLRSEKGYRHLGADIGPADDPYSAGLGFTLALDKPGGFLGREAVSKIDSKNLARRTVYVALEEPETLLFHDETVFCNGVAVGRVTSGSFGHTLGRAVGIASVAGDIDFMGSFAVESQGTLHPATISRRPFYDPRGERLRG